MSDIRFNSWYHQSGTGGVHQDGAGNIGIGTTAPTSALDIRGADINIDNNVLFSSGVSTFSGSVTFDGSSTFSGNSTFSGGSIFSGVSTFSGGSIFSGVSTFSGSSSNFDAGIRLTSTPFLENVQGITTDYTVTSNTNAMSIGPIGINTGVTVAIQTGGNWAII